MFWKKREIEKRERKRRKREKEENREKYSLLLQNLYFPTTKRKSQSTKKNVVEIVQIRIVTILESFVEEFLQ